MLTEIVSKSSLIPDLSGLKIYPALLESILEKASLSSKNPGSNSVWQNPLLQENQHFRIVGLVFPSIHIRLYFMAKPKDSYILTPNCHAKAKTDIHTTAAYKLTHT